MNLSQYDLREGSGREHFSHGETANDIFIFRSVKGVDNFKILTKKLKKLKHALKKIVGKWKQFK